MKIILTSVALLALFLGLASADRRFPLRSLAAAASPGGNQPYWFLAAPRRTQDSFRAVNVPLAADDYDDSDDDAENSFQQPGTFAIVQDDNDSNEGLYAAADINEENFENNNNDPDSEVTGNVVGIVSLHSNGIIELEEPENDNNEIEDEEEEHQIDASKAIAIFLPREVLEKIPKGSIVALVEDSEGLGRAMKRIVRRRVTNGPQRRRQQPFNINRRRRGGRPGTVKIRRVVRPNRNNNRNGNRKTRINVIQL